MFRGDIQGLRALAVLLVILDHARIGPFHGGFVGVDVFFVISGFLITGLLLSEAERTGRISLLGLLRPPGPPDPARGDAGHPRDVVGSGIYLLSAVEAEGDRGRALGDVLRGQLQVRPRRHRLLPERRRRPRRCSTTGRWRSRSSSTSSGRCWCCCSACYAPWRARRSAGQRSLGPRVRDLGVSPLVVIVGVSFAFSVFRQHDRPGGGLLLAVHPGLGARHRRADRLPEHPADPAQAVRAALLAWGGLVAVVAAALPTTGRRSFPGTPRRSRSSAPPRCCRRRSRRDAGGRSGCCRLRPMRAVGDWSYSLYLWHWPVLIIAGSLGAGLGWPGVLVIAGVVPLAAVSYHFVENPVRRMRIFKPGRLRGLCSTRPWSC